MKKKIALFGLLLLTGLSNAQTFTAGTMYPQYSDVSPDHLMYYTYFPYTHFIFDLNVFGATAGDIEFTSDGGSGSGGSSAYISIKSLNPDVYISMGRLDSVYDSTSTSWLVTKVARPLNAGDPINLSGAIWDNSTQAISDHSASFGWTKDINDWIGGDRYVGLKYQNGSSISYGWIRVQCISKDSCYVKDFSSVASNVGIWEISGAYPSVYPNPATDVFYLDHLKGVFDEKKLSFTDLSGREVQYAADFTGEKIKFTSSCSPGCYLLKYQDDANSFAKKIVIGKP